jgi:8-oxo-dGTP diphosphatase
MIDHFRLVYTICFVISGDQVLMLRRRRSPNGGLWNGLGGKIQAMEEPETSIRREVWEEAQLNLSATDVRFAGLVTWRSSDPAYDRRGMYAYLATLPDRSVICVPLDTSEGLIDWKKIEWVSEPGNLEVVDNIPLFLPRMLSGEVANFYCVYDGGALRDFCVRPLS